MKKKTDEWNKRGEQATRNVLSHVNDLLNKIQEDERKEKSNGGVYHPRTDETYAERIYREAEERAEEHAKLCEYCGERPWKHIYDVGFPKVAARSLARTEQMHLCDKCAEEIKRTVEDNRQANGVWEKDQIEPTRIERVD